MPVYAHSTRDDYDEDGEQQGPAHAAARALKLGR